MAEVLEGLRLRLLRLKLLPLQLQQAHVDPLGQLRLQLTPQAAHGGHHGPSQRRHANTIRVRCEGTRVMGRLVRLAHLPVAHLLHDYDTPVTRLLHPSHLSSRGAPRGRAGGCSRAAPPSQRTARRSPPPRLAAEARM